MKKSIHIWLTAADYQNANLMILLAYIILGHKEWNAAEIKILAVYPEDSIETERERLFRLIELGQLPISPSNVEFIVRTADRSTKSVIVEKSRDADLTILGFQMELTKHEGEKLFHGYEGIGNVLFVNAAVVKEIK